MDLQTDVNKVLADMAKMAAAAAKDAGEDAIKLAQRAADIAAKCATISDPLEKLQALESVGHGMKSGLAAIANKRAREALDNIIGRSLDFAKTILGGLLGMF